MTDFRESEYQALRATIRERGTVRVCAVLAGLAIWGGLAIFLRVTNLRGSVSFIPLLVLGATHEINFFIHTGVERIGRYIQVFYEEPTRAANGWETTAMSYGIKFPGGLDPLFTMLFYGAIVVDFLNSLAGPWWIAISAIVHGAFVYRVFSTRRLAASQRATDLERLRQLVSGR